MKIRLLCFFLLLSLSPLSCYGVVFKHQVGFFGAYGFHSIFSPKLNIERYLFNGHFPSGGIFYNFSHINYARIQIEILYTRKGSYSDEYISYFDCLSIPLLFRFQDYSGFFFKLGFGISWLIHGEIQDKRRKEVSNFKKDIFQLAHDIIFGLGWRFKINNFVWIYIENRFTATINNLNQVYSDYDNSIRPFNIDFSLGFEFLNPDKQKK